MDNSEQSALPLQVDSKQIFLPPRVAYTPKRRAIMEYLAKHGSITVTEAAQLVGGNLYANANKHTGVTLSSMVKAGLIVRTSRGTFAMKDHAKS